MDLRQALFFSSKSIAVYDTSVPMRRSSNELNLKSYHLQVEIVQEEYQPLFAKTLDLRDVFQVTVARKHDEKIYEPHVTHKIYGLDQCIEYLQTWGVNIEDGWWIPEETWDEQ